MSPGALSHRVLTKIPSITVAPHRTSHGEDRVDCGEGVRDSILERYYSCAEMRHEMRLADRLGEENKVQGWPEEFWPKHLSAFALSEALWEEHFHRNVGVHSGTHMLSVPMIKGEIMRQLFYWRLCLSQL